jgi:acetoin utilization deacetylase AcuC-like enzyme
LEGKHSSAFAIVRPPGHHAGLKSQPHGFCFLNNVGLGAKYAQKKYNKERILILDWDAHHG